jgi:hypothetical protein
MFLHTIKIEHASPDDGIRMHREVQALGLVHEKDYVWRFEPATYDNFSISNSTSRRVVFEFVDASMASFFGIKWL